MGGTCTAVYRDGEGDRVLAVPFNVTVLRTTGSPVSVQDGVFTKIDQNVLNVVSAADGMNNGQLADAMRESEAAGLGLLPRRACRARCRAALGRTTLSEALA